MEKGYLNMKMLRFTTAGSVDDGKSTLIGRLLYDSKSIFEDQLEAVETASKNRGNEEVNLALLTDGLKAEREQGITIDVAYRYFATPKRKFIIADTPGHVQYTRNMVTGASTSDLAIILVDARHGIMEQTIRHSYIASILGLAKIVVCINKMDLVNYSQEIFEKIKDDYKKMSSHLGDLDIDFIPMSAKIGDNVVNKSNNMKWYTGKPLLEYLETVDISHKNSGLFKMSVQYVIRPISNQFRDFRGYAGRIAQGNVSKGDTIKILPSGYSSKIISIWEADKEILSASKGESVSICLSDDIDISRGDCLVADNDTSLQIESNLRLTICWFNVKGLILGQRYIIRHAAQETLGIFKSINHKVDITTQKEVTGITTLNMNDIGDVELKTARPLVFETYAKNKVFGSIVVIDQYTNETVGAGMIQ